MKSSPIIFIALAIILLVCGAYFYHFFVILKYELSPSTSTWGELGDYIGGLLNPILSFFSIVLLIKSLNIQVAANSKLIEDLEAKEKLERLRSFEILFFNMIDSQKDLFKMFEISTIPILNGFDAVNYIELEIGKLRASSPKDDAAVSELLTGLDDKDQLFSQIRVFDTIVKLICEKLSDINGFGITDRASHIRALVSFTDFAQLRLIMILVQFYHCDYSANLKENQEFKNIMQELKFPIGMY